MSYGASSRMSTRLQPVYYVPEFNKKAPWRIEVIPPEGDDPPAVGNTWDNSDTTTEYNVTINIYDLLGRKVETIVSENKPAGFHQVIWNATDKPSGIYFYKIQEGEYTKTKKMLLLK